MRYLFLFLMLVVIQYGCAGIEPPAPDRIIAPLRGVSTMPLGKSKEYVRNEWGEPDEIKHIGADDTGLMKEEWIYYSRGPEMPVGHQYFTRTKRLIFTGDYLTAYESGDAPRAAEKDTAKE